MRRAFLVRGRSMEPNLRDGDLVLVCSPRATPKAGDVVVYRHREGGFCVVHRLIGSRAHGWLTRGDAVARVDPDPVADSDIVGRVWCVVPRVGRLLAAFGVTRCA